jgi:glucosamine--fructose-6-phosphate aminotransferase (isomerizing)
VILSNLTTTDGGRQQFPEAGAHTFAEILSQPRCWANCLKQLESGGRIDQIGKEFGKIPEWMFVGCGSSFYVALTAAASWSMITGERARALPASELLLFPDLAFNGTKEFIPVLISRSGQTSEVLRVAQLLNQKQIPSLAVTCAPKQMLESLATISIVLPDADEQSTVMTRSFTSMLLALQYLAAQVAGNHDFQKALKALPAAAEKALRDLPFRVRAFVNQHSFRDYVCLGQGPYYGLACESALKVMEMSRTYAQSFHTLEFRHGPKSIVNAETLITFLLSEADYHTGAEVLDEVKQLGGTTVAVANRFSDKARDAANLLIELDCALPEASCLASFSLAGQLIGFYAAVQKGLDPDRPANLSRVVRLEDEREQPESASL